MRPGAEQRQISSSSLVPLPSFLPSSLLSPTHQPPPTPTDHATTTSTASCCCPCGLSDSIRWAGGSRGKTILLSLRCRNTHETSSPVGCEIRISLRKRPSIPLSLALFPFAKLSGTAIFQSMTHTAAPCYRLPPAPYPLPPLIYEHEPLSRASLIRLMKCYFLAWLRSNSVAELQKTAYGSILLPWLPSILPLLCSSKMPEICRGLSEWGRGGGRSDGAGAGEVSFWRALFDKRSSFFLSMFGAAGSMASGSGIGQH